MFITEGKGTFLRMSESQDVITRYLQVCSDIDQAHKCIDVIQIRQHAQGYVYVAMRVISDTNERLRVFHPFILSHNGGLADSITHLFEHDPR